MWHIIVRAEIAIFLYQVTEGEVVATIQRLNNDPKVHAILLQLPLDSETPIDDVKCTNTIAINKVTLYMYGMNDMWNFVPFYCDAWLLSV